VVVEAKDRSVDGVLSSTTLLTVNVMDSDDQGPVFSHSLYTASLRRGTSSGALDIRPDKIQAQDQDSLRYAVLTFLYLC
jgi:hypothetical protein